MRALTRIGPAYLIAALVLSHWTAPALAQTSAGSISLQGKLAGVSGGERDLVVRVYAAGSGGSPVATIPVNDVPVTAGGVFSVAVPVGHSVFDGSDRWWTVAVDGGAELSPRTLVTSVPLAFSANTLWNGAVRRLTNGPSPLVDTNSLYLRNPAGPVGARSWGLVVRTSDGRLSIGQSPDEPSQGALSTAPLALEAGAPSNSLRVSSTGRIGINRGDSTVRARLDVQNTGAASYVLRLDNTVNNGGLFITTVPGSSLAPLVVDHDGERLFTVWSDGRTSVRTLQIRGGSDLAEPFDVTTGAGAPAVEPGMVLVIDPDRDGQLIPCAAAYDTAVAGVVSGAGGLSPGMVMSAEGVDLADGGNGKHPVAMTGRVWCLVDASFGSIKRGDRLTTSATPGHAMRVSEGEGGRAPGATIGKAMTELEDGRGLVLVLVNLQ